MAPLSLSVYLSLFVHLSLLLFLPLPPITHTLYCLSFLLLIFFHSLIIPRFSLCFLLLPLSPLLSRSQISLPPSVLQTLLFITIKQCGSMRLRDGWSWMAGRRKDYGPWLNLMDRFMSLACPLNHRGHQCHPLTPRTRCVFNGPADDA